MSVPRPSGTVTLLLADVEDSTRLWQLQPEQMEAAIAGLDRAVSEAIAAHGGVRSVEQGEGDSFVVAFDRASDAAGCALDLQRAQLAPIKLRIGLHTGEVQLRDEGSYAGPTINRTASLRDLAYGGQTVMSATTGDLVIDNLPADAWLINLGSQTLRDLSHPERVMQLCHPDLQNSFPALRTPKHVPASKLPVQVTTFIGGDARTKAVQRLLADNRLLTLTGEGGVGKSRLAIQVAAASGFGDDLSYVELAPLTDPAILPIAVVRALGLTDQPGRSTIGAITHFIDGRHQLMVLDNCEHVLDACAELVVALLGACPALTILATSREPIGVAGEITWRVPSLSLADEAIELFVDRARLVQPAFRVVSANAEAVREICQRLDGIPLAIELAAARVRSLSPVEIAESLDDRFRLLTGSARSVVRRQQTLSASMDWSYALLTESERTLFRRLAVFPGTFDLAAARAVAGNDLEIYQILDQLTLLVDKSLVVVEDVQGRTRYRLRETVREYALGKLDESGETDLPARHCDYYKALASRLDAPGQCDHLELVEQAELEIDNLRACFTWNRKNNDGVAALQLASWLQPIWFGRGRQREGLAWFDSILENGNADQFAVSAGVWARALADKVMLSTLLATSPVGAPDIIARAGQALAIARDIDDSTVLVRALTACGCSSGYQPEAAQAYLGEAIELARALDDKWTLSQILYWRLVGTCMTGDPRAVRAAADEAQELAESIGDRFVSRQCRLWRSAAHMWEGDLNGAIARLREVTAEAEAANDVVTTALGLYIQALALAHLDASAAEAAAAACIAAAAELGGVYEGCSYAAASCAALATGNVSAIDTSAADQRNYCAHLDLHRELMAQLALVRGDASVARCYADDAVASTSGWHRMVALITRARVAIAHEERDAARNDAHAALVCATDLGARVGVPDAIELLAALNGESGSHCAAARLFGAAAALRQRTQEVRFQVWEADYQASVAALRDAMSGDDFASAWADGAAMSTDEAIRYAQRGRGKRKRWSGGWGSLTPAERNVARLVGEGLGNKEIATRLFVSPRTVQSHLTHVYAKLRLNSRVQLAQEAARHS
ncbi:transcriptional regulator [Mycobacterium haemophilum DSM 44634]|uniref:helix-turn-helix transcriptional regulator n=1 Tax=Mycobacterium haemophilum TaxID=29311 RepID=UPI0006D3EBA5|nr:LuxR C-terminal-related transcriptional regulator [Mycobacterium haemophilum]AKN18707.2 transcriptional regulator [Mycobacterium haemophilum DSM 44634]MCV7339669.1 LuxR family transcriptional regulator [Mycobacterium haemophilum DSM 44634]